VSERDRLLWTAIRRALLMIVSAIEAYLQTPARSER